MDYAVEAAMSSYWINFVKTGNPNGKDLPEWKKYDAVTNSIMNIDTKPQMKPAMFKPEFQFLESVD